MCLMESPNPRRICPATGHQAQPSLFLPGQMHNKLLETYLKKELHVAGLIVEPSKSPHELRNGAGIHVVHQRGQALGNGLHEGVGGVEAQRVPSPQQLL